MYSLEKATQLEIRRCAAERFTSALHGVFAFVNTD
jgi:hypothetical protein